MPPPVNITTPVEIVSILSNSNIGSAWHWTNAVNLTSGSTYYYWDSVAIVETAVSAGTVGNGFIGWDAAGSSFDGAGTPEIITLLGGGLGLDEHLLRMNNTNGMTTNGIDAYVTNIIRFSNGNLCFNIKMDVSNTTTVSYDPTKVLYIGLEKARHSTTGLAKPIVNPKATWVPLGAGTNGFAVDGTWHLVKIPMSAFYVDYSTNDVLTNAIYQAGPANYNTVTLDVIDLSNITGVFCVENQASNTAVFQIDNIHFER